MGGRWATPGRRRRVAPPGNTVHSNSGSGNVGALLAGNPANDTAPASTAAAATSPVGNLSY